MVEDYNTDETGTPEISPNFIEKNKKFGTKKRTERKTVTATDGDNQD